MITISINGIRGIKNALSKLKRIDGIVYNWMRVGEADKIMHDSFSKNFTQQGRPKKWSKLAENTKKDRLSKGFKATPILFRTGNLRDDVTNVRSKITRIGNSVEAIWGPDGLREKEKFIHNQGGTKKMPARPMMIFNDKDGPKLIRSFAEFLGKQL